MSFTVDFDFIDQMPKNSEDEGAPAEDELTPETGRGNERRLSEGDNITLSPGDSASGQVTTATSRTNSTPSSDVQQVRPDPRILLQARPSQVNPPAQASYGNPQHTTHQPLPYQLLPHQPLPHQPRQNSLYHAPQNTPIQSTQGTLRGSAPPWHPHMQQTQYGWPMNQPANYGYSPHAMHRGIFTSTADSGLLLYAPSYPQIPSQYSSGGGSQISNPAEMQVGTSWRGAALGSTNSYNQQSLANSRLPPYPVSARLPPNTGMPPNIGVPIRRDERNPVRLGSGSRASGNSSSQLSHTGFPSRSGPGFQISRSSLLGPPSFQRQHVSLTVDPWKLCSKAQSTRGHANTALQQVESPRPGQPSADAPHSDTPRVTTPEAEAHRNARPSFRDESVLNSKVYLLATKIWSMPELGHSYSGLPEVTAEEIQDFRQQYRSMPALRWSQDAVQLREDLARSIIQAMKLLGSSLEQLWQHRQPTGPAQSASGTRSADPAEPAQLPGTTQSDDDGHVPEYLLHEFMSILELNGEQEALRFLRESKARAIQGSQGSSQSQRKRSQPGRRSQAFSLDEVFAPGDDDIYGGALAFGPMRSGDIEINDDLAAFGITEIRNARGEIMVGHSSRRHISNNNNNSRPALNRTIEIHVEDDLVGAAESSAPVEKFRRLMNPNPPPKSPKKRPKI